MQILFYLTAFTVIASRYADCEFLGSIPGSGFLGSCVRLFFRKLSIAARLKVSPKKSLPLIHSLKSSVYF